MCDGVVWQIKVFCNRCVFFKFDVGFVMVEAGVKAIGGLSDVTDAVSLARDEINDICGVAI